MGDPSYLPSSALSRGGCDPGRFSKASYRKKKKGREYPTFLIIPHPVLPVHPWSAAGGMYPRIGSCRAQIFGRTLARSIVTDDIVGDLLALGQRVHAGSLDGADMDEHVCRSVLRLNEAEALCGVEPLYRTIVHVENPFINERSEA